MAAGVGVGHALSGDSGKRVHSSLLGGGKQTSVQSGKRQPLAAGGVEVNRVIRRKLKGSGSAEDLP